MTAEKLAIYYENKHSCRSASYLRFILMVFVCFWNFGSPEPTGVLNALSGFAIPAFYILSGFFILNENKEVRQKKTVRKIKKSLLWFGFIALGYILINIAFCLINKISVKFSLRIAFNFLALNIWPLPIGNNIWFIQSLLYAYIVIFIADKLNLMKFYKTVMVLTFIFMLLTGEFSGVIHFHVLGYDYIPGNWLTRGLPYLLLGMFMREKLNYLADLKIWKYITLFVVGILLTVGEILLLGHTGNLNYEGHMIGYGLMAAAVCGFVIVHPKMKVSHITAYDTAYTSLIYSFMEPLYYVVLFIGSAEYASIISRFGGLITYTASIVISFALLSTPLWHNHRKKQALTKAAKASA